MPIPGDNVLWGSRALLQGAGLTPETSNVAALLRTEREVRFFLVQEVLHATDKDTKDAL